MVSVQGQNSGQLASTKSGQSEGMLKCYTLSYDPIGDGFDTGLLDKELAGKAAEVLHVELFSYDGLPRLNLVLSVRSGGRAARKARVDWRGSLRESEQPLYDALREWRRDVAVGAALTSYLVMSNRVLAGLAATRPDTAEALLEVPGIGSKKAEQYGAAVLEVIARHGE